MKMQMYEMHGGTDHLKGPVTLFYYECMMFFFKKKRLTMRMQWG